MDSQVRSIHDPEWIQTEDQAVEVAYEALLNDVQLMNYVTRMSYKALGFGDNVVIKGPDTIQDKVCQGQIAQLDKIISLLVRKKELING